MKRIFFFLFLSGSFNRFHGDKNPIASSKWTPKWMFLRLERKRILYEYRFRFKVKRINLRRIRGLWESLSFTYWYNHSRYQTFLGTSFSCRANVLINVSAPSQHLPHFSFFFLESLLDDPLKGSLDDLQLFLFVLFNCTNTYMHIYVYYTLYILCWPVE